MAKGFYGKYFSITEPQDVKTVIYRVNHTPKEILRNDTANKYPKYTIERLIKTEEIRGDYSKKTFFVDYPEPSGEDLVILSFAKQKVVVNMGFLKDNKLKINKKPASVRYEMLYSNDKSADYKVFNYTPNFKRAITIIDPETTNEVKPMVFEDSQTHQLKGKCELLPNKPYFAFEVGDMKK